MKLQRMLISGVFCALLFAGASVSAQNLEPSFDITLQLLVASSDGARSELPPALAGVTRQLEKTYGPASFRLANTFQGRINNGGTFAYKSVGNVLGRDTPGMPQPFMEWTVTEMRSRPTAKGSAGLQAEAFHFGARVPVAIATDKAQFQYENIGIDSRRLGIAEDTPTMIGTLTLPGAGGTMFLIMTVRSADL